MPFENAVSYIERHFAERITLRDLSGAAGMSTKYFCEYFKKITGQTPVEYLNSFRIERACALLWSRDMQVTEIAPDCGFNDLSYFIKAFKAQKGVTPGRYRVLRNEHFFNF